MMNKMLKFFVLVLAFIIYFPRPAGAQNKISNSVFGNGGARVSSNSFRVVGTAGQPAIGITRSNSSVAQIGFWAQTIGLVTSVEQIPSETIPQYFSLSQNYPNPFNPTTTIQFALPKPSSVTLKIYDILGREVLTLVDEDLQPGEYKVEFDASSLASGVYIYRLEAEGFVQAKKLTLLK